MITDNVVMHDFAFIGLLVGIAAGMLLLGCAFGYYTAASDLNDERKKAWNEGRQAGIDDFIRASEASAPILTTDNPYEPRRPFLRSTKATSKV